MCQIKLDWQHWPIASVMSTLKIIYSKLWNLLPGIAGPLSSPCASGPFFRHCTLKAVDLLAPHYSTLDGDRIEIQLLPLVIGNYVFLICEQLGQTTDSKAGVCSFCFVYTPTLSPAAFHLLSPATTPGFTSLSVSWSVPQSGSLYVWKGKNSVLSLTFSSVICI